MNLNRAIEFFHNRDRHSEHILLKLSAQFTRRSVTAMTNALLSKRGQVFGEQKGNRRYFSADDDQVLRQLKSMTPELSFPEIADRMRGFTARQLRERWFHYLSPDLNTSSWTDEDDRRLMELFRELGPKWGAVGAAMGNRPPPYIKNRFKLLQKRERRETHAAENLRKRIAKRLKRHQVKMANLGLDVSKIQEHHDVQSEDMVGSGVTSICAIPNDAKADRKDSQKDPGHGPIDFSIRNLLV
jgi:DNA-binding transcriptional MerR regulator